MDGDAVNLCETLFYAIFEGCRDVVDLGDRQVTLHRAMARRQNAVGDLTDVDVVAIHQLIVFSGERI